MYNCPIVFRFDLTLHMISSLMFFFIAEVCEKYYLDFSIFAFSRVKKLSIWYKKKFVHPYMFLNLMVQTSATFGFKDTGIKKSEFVPKTLFLLVDLELRIMFFSKYP